MTLIDAILTHVRNNGITVTTTITGDLLSGIIAALSEPKTKAFETFATFGTGGLATKYPSKAGEYGNRWYDFKNSLGFPTGIPIKSHNGAYIYYLNKELFDAHPEWFRNNYDAQRLCFIDIEIPEAVEAYANAVIAESTDFVIGAEPEDGKCATYDPMPKDGFEGLTGWTCSEKWCWFANYIAAKVPDKIIQIYSYIDTSIPRFKLRDNVQVILTAYSYSGTNESPESLVKRWGAYHHNVGVYDYWMPTDWSKGLPLGGWRGLIGKLKFWAQQGIKHVYLESIDAKGAMLPVWYIASRFIKDTSLDVEQLYSDFLKEHYGDAAGEVRKIYDRWENQYQAAGEVGITANNLKAALKIVSGSEYRNLCDLIAYWGFMKMFYFTPHSAYKYLLSVDDRLQVPTPAMLLINAITLDGSEAQELLTDADLIAMLEADKSLTYDVTELNFDPEKVQALEPIPQQYGWCFGNKPDAFVVVKYPTTFYIGCEEKRGGFTFECGSIKETVTDEHCDFVEDRQWDCYRNYVVKKYVLPVGRHEFKLFGVNTRVWNEGTDAVLFLKPKGLHSNPGFDNARYPMQYAVVPSDIKHLVIWNYDTRDEGLQVDGSEVKYMGNNLYIVDASGIVKMQFAQDAWKILNGFNYTTLQKINAPERG